MSDEQNEIYELVDVVQNPVEEGMYIPNMIQAQAMLQAVQIIERYEVLHAQWGAIPWDAIKECATIAEDDPDYRSDAKAVQKWIREVQK